MIKQSTYGNVELTEDVDCIEIYQKEKTDSEIIHLRKDKIRQFANELLGFTPRPPERFNKLTDDQLIQRLGVITTELQACRRGNKEFPEDEVIAAAVTYFNQLGFDTMIELKRRGVQ